MLRCWDVEPTLRPVFCELSAAVAVIIAQLKAVAAATLADTKTALRLQWGGYVNTPSVSEYLRPRDVEWRRSESRTRNDDCTQLLQPVDDRSTRAEQQQQHLQQVIAAVDLSTESSPAATDTDTLNVDDDASTAD